uniref:ZP domain-containing protein n=1 Tax=Panagrellus redivivus TaxID=6233 RepID=A0A7E4UN11_PANRE
MAAPYEVGRIYTEVDLPFRVEYHLDECNTDRFKIEQVSNYGTLMQYKAIKGERKVVIRVHIRTFTTNHVLIGDNLAIITVYVSPRPY